MIFMTLPDDFIKYTRQLMGDRMWQTLEAGLADEPPVSVRLNPFKCNPDMADIVCGDGIVPWCANGRYLKRRLNFTFDPLMHAGVYYVQDASSMFLERVLRRYVADKPVRVLDLCAAPGGKSTLARSVLPEGSLLFCNEPVHGRAMVLAENVQKLGHEDVVVTNSYPADYGKSGLVFDVVIADVPCSGEGMFRKDEGAREEWSLGGVEKCRRLQRSIVQDVWNCLRPGGLLIYSTCTFNVGENEENVRYVADELGADVLPVDTDVSWGITGSLLEGFDAPVYRFLPGLTRGEGLFMAVLRKHGEDSGISEKKGGKKADKTRAGAKKHAVTLKDNGWMDGFEDYSVRLCDGFYRAVHRWWGDIYDVADKRLRVIHAGITVGEVRGKDIVPAQSLLLSRTFRKEAFPCVELEHTEAVAFLRREAVPLSDSVPRGPVVMTYRGCPIGFQKNIGNRANNLYPAEWKIKSTYVPADDCDIIVRGKDDDCLVR